MTRTITLIFTRHRDLGFCNSNALLQIIEQVKPDVIFEELSEVLYEEAYVAYTLNNLETFAIKKYLAIRDVPHIPVDTYPRTRQFSEDQSVLEHRLINDGGYESFQLCSFLDSMQSVIYKYGFYYLNDPANDENMTKIQDLRLAVLRKLGDPMLDEMYRKSEEVILNREDVMLGSVYSLCKENSVQNGLMFIGSGHRKSIIKKIVERGKSEEIKINWRFFADLKIAFR
jgi:hypothetical protein